MRPARVSFLVPLAAPAAEWELRLEPSSRSSKRLIGTWQFEKVNPDVELSEEDFR